MRCVKNRKTSRIIARLDEIAIKFEIQKRIDGICFRQMALRNHAYSAARGEKRQRTQTGDTEFFTI